VAAEAVVDHRFHGNEGPAAVLDQPQLGAVEKQRPIAADVVDHHPQRGRDQRHLHECHIAHQALALAGDETEAGVARDLDGRGHQGVEAFGRQPGAVVIEFVDAAEAAALQSGLGIEAFDLQHIGERLEIDR
jgi:hypothetical protein